MNKSKMSLLYYLDCLKCPSQREIARVLHISLGKVNKIIKELCKEELITVKYETTQKGKKLLEKGNTQKAIILAAGVGFRMFPLNKSANKALLNIGSTTLIERLILQLHEAAITDITVVVGYLKEDFDFLIDQYGVKLCINNKYVDSNTAYSLYQVKSDYANCYIMPADIYFEENPFRKKEFVSWYMMSSTESDEWSSVLKKEKVSVSWFNKYKDNMVGLAFVHQDQSNSFKTKLEKNLSCEGFKDKFWEDCIFEGDSSLFFPAFIDKKMYIECNTCEDLIRIDASSKSLDIEVFNIITDVFNVSMQEIQDIVCAKAGMTNNSFLFVIHGKKYMMRIPGEGTSNLINRVQEDDTYMAIKSYNISDNVLYFNRKTGYKITEFIEGSHNCDSSNWEEVEKAIKFLHKFHELELNVTHSFDIFEKIDYYEALWDSNPSIYKDYNSVKTNVLKLKKFIDSQPKQMILTHIDAVPDNFLFYESEGKEYIKLIDWEYAAMQDPHIDLAMFSIYALYEKKQIDRLIDMYFSGCCDFNTKIKIYCYVAACGLLWSNWCEYKRQLGVEFGEYSIRQYRYAKDFYKIIVKEIGENDGI